MCHTVAKRKQRKHRFEKMKEGNNMAGYISNAENNLADSYTLGTDATGKRIAYTTTVHGTKNDAEKFVTAN